MDLKNKISRFLLD